MRLTSHSQAANTRAKLERLEAYYQEALAREMGTPELKQLSLYSLRLTINQLKEELIRFECDVKSNRIKDAATAANT